MELNVRLNSVEEALALVNKLEYHKCKAEAYINQRIIDARSLMGMLEFGVGKTIKIVIHSPLEENVLAELLEFVDV